MRLPITTHQNKRGEINSEGWQLLPEIAINGFIVKQDSQIRAINLQQNQQETKTINNIRESLKA